MDARIGRVIEAMRRLLAGALTLLAVVLAAGCTTNSKSRAQAQAAFQAGQNQALLDVASRQNGITFVGPVANPVVPWTDGLSLGQAVAAAGWTGKAEPRIIVFIRGGENVQMTPAQLFEAALFPVEPGDRIELIP